MKPFLDPDGALVIAIAVLIRLHVNRMHVLLIQPFLFKIILIHYSVGSKLKF